MDLLALNSEVQDMTTRKIQEDKTAQQETITIHENVPSIEAIKQDISTDLDSDQEFLDTLYSAGARCKIVVGRIATMLLTRCPDSSLDSDSLLHFPVGLLRQY